VTQLNYQVLLKEKADLLGEYKNLTEKVQTRLNQKDERELMACMKARGRLINRINRIDHVLMPHGSYINPATDDDGGKSSFVAMFKDMQELLNGIASIEKECLYSAKAEWKAIKGDILAARQNRKRTKGYGYHDAAAKPARFVDTRIT